jgi:hypothetical protein
MELQQNQQNKNEESNQFYRFQVIQGEKDQNGKVKKSKSVGMAYLKEGQNIITLRLWMLSNERYYVLPNKNDSTKYLVMTREPNRNPHARNKYHWNIVGSGCVDSTAGFIELHFDLLSQPIFVSIHPESSVHSSTLPDPDSLMAAA